MASFSRDLRYLFRIQGPAATCAQRYLFSTSSAVRSGHNGLLEPEKDKGSADEKKLVQGSALAEEISDASKLRGGDQSSNLHLAKVDFHAFDGPLSSSYAHTARSQGISIAGVALKTLGLEVTVDYGILAMEIWSDNRSRTEDYIFSELIHRRGTSTYPPSEWRKVLFEIRPEIGEDFKEDIEAQAGFSNVGLDSNITVLTKSKIHTLTTINPKIKDLKLVRTPGFFWEKLQRKFEILKGGAITFNLVELINVLHCQQNVYLITIKESDGLSEGIPPSSRVWKKQ